MELFDELDCRGERTGRKVPRDVAHRDGVWHGAFHCLILTNRNGKPQALFQRRSSRKQIAPDRYDVSVGGHYAAGEDASTAGPREIREELGLDVRFTDLVPVGKRTFVYCFTPGIKEYEFQDVFLLVRDMEPSQLILQADEVSSVLLLDIDQGVGIFSGALKTATGMQYQVGTGGVPVAVSAEAFVPCLDNYYLKLLLLARRYLREERECLVI